jgi:hypothetical protein
LVLTRVRGVLPQEMTAETAESRQTQISRRWHILPTRLEVIKKCEDVLPGEVIDAEAGHRAPQRIRQEAEEQAQCVAVSEKRVSARSANALQVVVEKRLHETEQGILVTRHRGVPPRNRTAKRRLARRSSSGVAVR